MTRSGAKTATTASKAARATAGHDVDDRVIYDTTTGNVWYDADGNGIGAAQLAATFDNHPTVAATDITVI